MARKKEISNQNIEKKYFFSYLNDVANSRKINKEDIVNILEESFKNTITKNLDPEAEIELIMDYDKEIIRLVNKNALVLSDEEYEKTINENEGMKTCAISLTEAKQLSSSITEDGDSILIDIEFEKLPKSIFLPVKQQFVQKITEMVRERTLSKYSKLKGTIVKAKLISITKSGYIYEIEEDQVHAFMPKQLSANSKRRNELGVLEEVYIEDIAEEAKDTQIILSTISNNILNEFLKREIPEIESGEIEIVRIARHAGERSKVAIKSNSETLINGLGALIGKSGNRIEFISKELDGEKIDVIEFSEDPVKFIVNALSPAKTVSVLTFRSKKSSKIVVVVPDSHHSLAIGKKGINVSLASELTRSRIDIYPYSKAINDEMNIVWNGNIADQQELELIELEAKNKLNSSEINSSNTHKTRKEKRKINPNYLLDEFDRDIQKYNEDFGLIEENYSIEKTNKINNVTNKDRMLNTLDANSIFEETLSDFENKISDPKTEIDNSYTKEELTQIQEEIKNYKIDNDLAAFAGLKDFDFDVNDADWDDEENEK
ncbi:transcription termination factor NusA [Mesomycoplasma molare]|uniref:Transcription termination/antitermination protein NusA n=1 Tax=Mesomycoplasma molare TaxID=171288 RepID=A0ABY5TWK1_9BACT|nr:transcription termination factor NusA [Mesomycoplasma molare]UWD34366.1 transcription termination factor NusA [Mesomycoplasma molare]